MAEKTYDTIVIGAGIIGASCANQLGKNGTDVAVVERDMPAGKATGRSSGELAVFRSNALSENISRYCREYYIDIEQKNEDITFHEGDGYKIAHSEEGKEYLTNLYQQGENEYVDDLLTPAELAELEPYLNVDTVTAAVKWKRDIHTDPYSLTMKMLNEAVESGVDLHTNEHVVDIHSQNDKFEIVTKTGSYKARKVINAAGAWSKVVAGMVGLDIPLKPRTSQVCIFEADDEVHLPRFACPDLGIYGRQEPNGEILVGGGPSSEVENPDKFSTSAREPFIQHVARNAANLSNSLANVELVNNWAERNSATPNQNPLVGETTVQDFYICAGFNGLGISHAPFAGRLIRDLIQENELIFDPAPYDPKQYDGSERVDLKGASTDW